MFRGSLCSLAPLRLTGSSSASPPQCGTIDSGSYVNLTERNLQDAQKFLLMHEVVQPVDPVPYFMEDSVRFTHVAVDVVQGKDVLFHIIFLATGTSCIIDSFAQENARKIPNR